MGAGREVTIHECNGPGTMLAGLTLSVGFAVDSDDDAGTTVALDFFFVMLATPESFAPTSVALCRTYWNF